MNELNIAVVLRITRVRVGEAFPGCRCGEGILADYSRKSKGSSSGATGHCRCGQGIAISETGAISLLTGENTPSAFDTLPGPANDN